MTHEFANSHRMVRGFGNYIPVVVSSTKYLKII